MNAKAKVNRFSFTKKKTTKNTRFEKCSTWSGRETETGVTYFGNFSL